MTHFPYDRNARVVYTIIREDGRDDQNMETHLGPGTYSVHAVCRCRPFKPRFLVSVV
jgi:hypothetical protein